MFRGTIRPRSLARLQWLRSLCWLLLLSGLWTPQLGASPSNFEGFGPEDGLPHRTVYDIAVDSRGFLWLATQNGLARFDGYDLQVFRHDPRDPSSLPNNYIRALSFDNDGVLWVGTNGGGLCRFDARQETFESFQRLGDGEPQVTRIDQIVVADDDHIWLTDDESVLLFKPSTASFQEIPSPVGTATSLFANRTQGNGSVWYLTEDRLYRLEADLARPPLEIPLPDGFEVYGAFTEDPSRLWLASEREFISYHHETGQWTSQGLFPESMGDLIRYGIRPITQDAEGTLWLGLLGVGLLQFDPNSGEGPTLVRPRVGGPRLTQVTAMAEDPSGILWFATYDEGLSKLDPTRQGGTLLQHLESDPQSLGPFGVRAVEVGPTGRTWVGHFGSGVDALDAQNSVRFRLSTTAPEGRRISHDAVWALQEDVEGRLWIGHETGLDRYDAKRNLVEPMQSQGGPFEGRITTLHEDHTGALYIGGSSGVHVWRPEDDLISPVLTSEPPSTQPAHRDLVIRFPVHVLHVDSKNNLWIGTDGDGLFRLDPTRTQLRHYASQLSGPSQVQLDIVSEIHEDADGVIWLTTLGGGLLRYDMAQDIFLPAPSDRPLLSTFVSSLLPADDGTFWLPTHNGLNHYDPTTGQVKTWDTSDGLPSRGFTTKASHLGAQGRLLLGSQEGLYVLDTEALGAHPSAPRPVLTQLNLFNRPVALQRLDPTSPLQQTLSLTESLTLRYDQNPFSIQFAALHFANPARNRYEYRLRGVDPRWIQASSHQRLAAYSHVPPGRYLFEVKATSRDGVPSVETAQLEIHILPPPWRTWWAYTLYTLALLAAVVAFVRAQRHKVLRERKINRQLDELVKLRTEQVKVLGGLLPICSSCKKIRDDEGYWSEVESYVEARSEAVFSHSLCPPCAKSLYPDLDLPGQT